MKNYTITKSIAKLLFQYLIESIFLMGLIVIIHNIHIGKTVAMLKALLIIGCVCLGIDFCKLLFNKLYRYIRKEKHKKQN